MPENNVLINLSNRHVHMCREDVEILFGKGHQLTKMKDLLQPGQFACEETVTIKGPKGSFEGVRILGPERKETQCEVMASDAFRLGLRELPCRESGQLDGSAAFELVGPKGSVKKTQGLIIAKRHLHFDPASAERFGVKDKQVVKLHAGGDRGDTFDNVSCKVNPAYARECHLDVDEGIAVGIGNGARGEVIL